jgi:phosphoribosyl 1,2-cyclic phosphodiesterase
MELIFAPLFSGSSGNCVYVGCGDTHLLVDAGVSCARIIAELGRVGVRPGSLNGVLVTHEHADHIKGIGILSRRLDLPVYATEETWAAMEGKVGGISLKNRRVFDKNADFYVGPLEIRAFSVPHDAADPVGYSFSAGGARFSVATDIGCVRESWLKEVAGSGAVLLESNYELGMLLSGSYPYALKQRIASRKGHLANTDAGEAAVELVNRGARRIILGHLSKENNLPELALGCCEAALREAGVRPGADMALNVARRDGVTGLYALRREETEALL